MTCIVGLVDGGVVWIGGDSAGVDDRYALSARRDPKVVRNGPFLFGFTSSFRMGQLLAHSFQPPKRAMTDDLYGWMVTDVINAIRGCLSSGGYAKKESDREEAGTFLVGYDGRLFKICDDYQVAENVCGYDACGCGDMIALGSLHATEGRPPEDRIRTALEAAEQFSAGVRGPFHVQRLDGG